MPDIPASAKLTEDEIMQAERTFKGPWWQAVSHAAARKARWEQYQVVVRHYEGVQRLNDPVDRGYAEACEDILAVLECDPWPDPEPTEGD